VDFDPLLDAARKLVDDGVTPACQLAVARDGDVVCFETFGDATNVNGLVMTSSPSPIPWASIRRWSAAVPLATATALATPHHSARPVAHYIPEFASNGKEGVTVEQVLLHTAGFPNAPMDPVEGGDPVTRVKGFTDWNLEWEPGSRFEYHALSAHWVLAELIERLSGHDFRDYIEERVCTPNGLPRVLGLLEEEQDDIAPGVPLGTVPADSPVPPVDTAILNRPDVRAAGVPGGGAFMTAAAMTRFYQALLHDSDRARRREPFDRARPRRRRRPAPIPLRHVRQGQLARHLRARRRALSGCVGRSRDRHLVLVPEERAPG